MKEKEKSVFAWLMDFASVHKNLYVASVIMATLGVLCSIVPYCIMGDMLTKLIDGNKDWAVYLKEGLVMTAFGWPELFFMEYLLLAHIKQLFMCLEILEREFVINYQKYPLDM